MWYMLNVSCKVVVSYCIRLIEAVQLTTAGVEMNKFAIRSFKGELVYLFARTKREFELEQVIFKIHQVLLFETNRTKRICSH